MMLVILRQKYGDESDADTFADLNSEDEDELEDRILVQRLSLINLCTQETSREYHITTSEHHSTAVTSLDLWPLLAAEQKKSTIHGFQLGKCGSEH